MKLLYIALCELWDKSEAGIRKKVFGQMRSLEKRFDTYLAAWRSMALCTFRDGRIIDKKVPLTLTDTYRVLEEFVEKEGIELIYLRYLKTNTSLNLFLKHMKQKGVRVLVEFPTLPYDKEIEGTVLLEEDRYYRKDLKKYVRYSTNFCGLNSTFGIPSVPIRNGVDLDEIPLKKERQDSDGIVMIAAASMNIWHGYDRLIRGIYHYYQENGAKPEVCLKLVGTGKEIPRYRDMIQTYGLDKHVLLTGVKYGEELTEEFDSSDIAIGSLGRYRTGIYSNSCLKSKEYCARGLPVVMGCEDPAFGEEADFIYRVPNDDSDIDVMGIVSFYDKWKAKGSSQAIRAFAEEYLSWDVQFNTLFQKINW